MSSFELQVQRLALKLSGKVPRVNPLAWEKYLEELTFFVLCNVLSIITPVAFVIALLIALRGGGIQSNFDLFLAIWSSTEIIFYGYCWRLMVSKAKPIHSAGISAFNQQRLIDEIITSCDCPKRNIAKWFLPDLGDDVSKDDVRLWWAWALYGKEVSDLNTEERDQVENCLRLVEKKSGPCKDTSYSKNRPIITNIIPYSISHKPLIFYAWVSLLQIISSVCLFSLGFQRHNLGFSQMTYWVFEPHPSQVTNEPPVFFVHGIGIGLLPYVMKLWNLQRMHPGRMILALELPYVSMVPISSPPTARATLGAIDAIFATHGITQCSWVSHSFGTYICAWVAQLRPHYVSQMALVDPVCFAMWEPDLMLNFFYNQDSSLVHRLTHFYLALDQFLAHTLHRHFYWRDSILLPTNITCTTTVYLSEHDFLINARNVHAYLKKAKKRNPRIPIKVVFIKDLTHGTYLVSEKHSSSILAQL